MGSYLSTSFSATWALASWCNSWSYMEFAMNNTWKAHQWAPLHVHESSPFLVRQTSQKQPQTGFIDRGDIKCLTSVSPSAGQWSLLTWSIAINKNTEASISSARFILLISWKKKNLFPINLPHPACTFPNKSKDFAKNSLWALWRTLTAWTLATLTKRHGTVKLGSNIVQVINNSQKMLFESFIKQIECSHHNEEVMTLVNVLLS